jgi:hypothetical protein
MTPCNRVGRYRRFGGDLILPYLEYKTTWCHILEDKYLNKFTVEPHLILLDFRAVLFYVSNVAQADTQSEAPFFVHICRYRIEG